MTSKLNIKPLFDNVLVKPLEAEKKSAGGIIIPDSVKEKPQVGEVMAVGTGIHDDKGKLIPMKVKVGDEVLFQWGDEITVDGVEYHMVGESSILAVIK